MIVSLPILLSAAIMGFVEIGQYMREDSSYTTSFGDFILNLPNLAQTALFLTVVAAFVIWPKWRMSSKVLKFGWIVAFVMPLFPAAFPLEFLIDRTYCEQVLGRDGCDEQVVMDKIILALRYAMTIIPVLITFPSGVLRGALRIRGLLPDSSLSSWVLAISAPFHSLLLFAAVVVIVQIVGSAPLIIGALLLCLAPWMYVFRRRLYVGAATDTNEKALDCNQKVILTLNLVGLVLIIVWAVTPSSLGIQPLGSGDDQYLMHYNKFISLVLETWGRTLATTVVFTDTLLRMTITDWRIGRNRTTDSDNGKRIDETFGLIESNISRDRTKGRDATTPQPMPEAETGETSNSPDTDEELGYLDEVEIAEDDQNEGNFVTVTKVMDV